MRSVAVSLRLRSLGFRRSSSSWRNQLAEKDGGGRRAASAFANCCSIVTVRPRRRQHTLRLLSSSSFFSSRATQPLRLLSFSSRAIAAVAAAAARSPLAHLTPEAREEVARVIELAERAAARWTLDRSCFLPPPIVAAALAALEPRADVAGVAWGGFAGAERARIVVGRPEDLGKIVQDEDEDDDYDEYGDEVSSVGGGEGGDGEGGSDGRGRGQQQQQQRRRNRKPRRNLLLDLTDPDVGGVSAVSISGNFAFDQASHRDFLGAVLGSAGIDRRVCGDVVVRGERGATALVSAEVAEALALSVSRVRSVPVEARQISLRELDFPTNSPPGSAAAAAAAPSVPVRSVEASLRLDAVASAGFRAPRSAAASAARAGELRLNYGEAKPSAAVAAGDLMSWRGKGRVRVTGVETTKKGKFAVEMERFTS